MDHVDNCKVINDLITFVAVIVISLNFLETASVRGQSKVILERKADCKIHYHFQNKQLAIKDHQFLTIPIHC